MVSYSCTAETGRPKARIRGRRFVNVDTTAVSHDAEFDPASIPSSMSEAFSVPLKKESFHAHRCDGPDPSVSVSKDDLIWMYKNMVQMRRMEQAADALYKQKLIRGFCHLAIGQEAVSIGMESAMEKDDKVITAYRCHPFAVMRGGTVKGVIAELLGRQGGMSHGKGGSMFGCLPCRNATLTVFSAGTSSRNPSLAATASSVPKCRSGQALPLRKSTWARPTSSPFRRESKKPLTRSLSATFAMYGDGASNQGQVFEAFNMAKLWALPTVFICENNKYGMGTSAERSSSNTDYYKRGDLIPGVQINAMDVLAVRRGIQYAKEWTTSGKGPMILEMVTVGALPCLGFVSDASGCLSIATGGIA
jgi:pyruvate dehydrogenase E1 component alpha subunit